MARSNRADVSSQTQNNTDICLITLNIRGLNSLESINKKLPKLKRLILNKCPDMLLLQETNINKKEIKNEILDYFKPFPCIFNGNKKGSGNLIIQISDRWKIIGHSTDKDRGRTTTMTVTRQEKTYCIVNVYAPADNMERIEYFNELNNKIANIKENIILAGDFNTTLEERDRIGMNTNNNSRPGRKELNMIIETRNLKDTYREKYKQNHITNVTWTKTKTNNTIGSRIDRVYVEKDEKVSKHIHIETYDLTDHKAVLIEINGTKVRHNKSPHWKFNNTLLQEEEYTQLIKYLIEKEVNEMKNCGSFLEKWDDFKEIIKEESILFATKINKDRKRRKELLENEINKAYKENNQEDKDILDKIEELHKINAFYYKGAKLRAGMRSDVTDETLTAVYLNIERTVQTARSINELIDENNTTITDENVIRQKLTDHYTRFFGYEETDNDAQDEILMYTKKLQDWEKDMLDEPITFEILEKSLNSLENDKTPGPDGLTTEFYKTFFPNLKPLFENLIGEILNEERLPTSQTFSIIKLLKKDPKVKTIKNLRPISLLNVDYKIITKSLTLKLLPYMASLIHPDQSASVPDRNALSNTNGLRDLITYINDKNDSALLLSLDMAAAFDRVSHSFIHKTLETSNFGPHFKKWIKIIYSNPFSALLINNKFSKLFPIERSVKQGDPLSSLIFVLTLEPLLEKIRCDKLISGVKIPGGDIKKIAAYADDTNFTIHNLKDIRQIIKHYELYSKASGAKLNKNKSKIMRIGKTNFEVTFDKDIEIVKEIKILGVIFKNEYDPNTHEQWEKILDKIIQRQGRFSYKLTTMFSRTFLINTFVLSKLNYLIQTFELPNETLKKIEKHVFSYLFDNKTTHSIARTTLIQNKLKGGTQIQHIPSKQEAYRIHYIQKIVSNPELHPFGILSRSSSSKKR